MGFTSKHSLFFRKKLNIMRIIILGGEKISTGYEIEIAFVEYLDHKKFEELNPLMQDVIQTLYPDVKPKDIIKAYKYGRYAKADIVISIRNKKRGISIKSGYKNSVHIEPLNIFEKYLLKNGVQSKNIELLYRYIYSDGTNNNTGIKRITNADYIDLHQEDIIELNKIFNYLKPQLIKRFLIETDTKYNVQPSVFIHGNVNDFIWATTEEVQNFLENEIISSSSVHSGKLYIQCWDKNIKRNPKYERCRNFIQVKWFSMYDDMILIMSRR